MEISAEKTLKPGKLVREAPTELVKVLLSEMQPGEVIVSFLETASDEELRTGNARVWVALTDRRALALAADDQGHSRVKTADTTTVARKGKLGRDEITIGELTYKCPLMRGGSEFKVFAQLAGEHHIERLRTAARARLEEGAPEPAVELAESGLQQEQDPILLTLRVLGLVAMEGHAELGEAMVALVKGDPDLTQWKELHEAIKDDARALWMLYQAAQAEDNGAKVRALLANLRTSPPPDQLTAELAITMDADEGELDRGLERAGGWRQATAITAEAFLSTCNILARAGLDTEPLHRARSMTLGELGNNEEALTAANQALAIEETPESLRVVADLLIRLGRGKEAVEPLEKVLGLGQDDFWIRSKLAEGYEGLGRLDDAVDSREVAMERLFTGHIEPEVAASERRALARLHRSIAESADSEEREIRLACADLLDRGLDWAARLADAPRKVFTGTDLTATVEILAARRLSMERTAASLAYVEAIVDPKAARPVELPPPSLLEGGIAGSWPSETEEGEGVQASKKTARVRYPLGKPTWADMGEGQPRGLHKAKIRIPVPDDVRPTYTGLKVRSRMELELSPPGARFPIIAAPCHDEAAEGKSRTEDREGTGKLPLRASMSNAAWSFGETGTLKIEGRLTTERVPIKIEAALIATERMRPPHKGERSVETLLWTFPIYDYERDEGVVSRELRIDLPRDGMSTGLWTWFELVWNVRVRLLRKGDKPEATVEVPVLLRYPAPDEPPAPPPRADEARATADAVLPPEPQPVEDDTSKTIIDGDPQPRSTLPGGTLDMPGDEEE